MKRTRSIVRICYVLVLCVSAVCLASDEQREGQDLLKKAAALENLRTPDAKPFHLHMKIHAQRIVSKPMDGTYEEIWIAPEKWRREIAFPGFSQVEVGDSNSKWVSRNLDFRPRVASLAAVAIEGFMSPDVLAGGKAFSLREKKTKGIAVRCLEFKGEHPPDRELCFDSSGALVNLERGNQRIEYDGFSKFGDKLIPRTIRFREAGFEVLSIDVGDPDLATDSVPQLFEHSTDAHQLAPCERWLAVASKTVAPHYPEDARLAYHEGTVVFYVLLSAGGKVAQLRVVESAGKSLDQSATESVRQWQYPPAPCGATPLPSEIEVRVNYSLSH